MGDRTAEVVVRETLIPLREGVDDLVDQGSQNSERRNGTVQIFKQDHLICTVNSIFKQPNENSPEFIGFGFTGKFCLGLERYVYPQVFT